MGNTEPGNDTGPQQRRLVRLPGDKTVTVEMLRRLLEDDEDIPGNARLGIVHHVEHGPMVILSWDDSL